MKQNHFLRLPLILGTAAFIAILPLILHGCSCGHDFDFHLLSWLEAAKQFRAGHLHPQWAFTPAYNAGEPRFVFYPPISWTLGALLTFIAPFAWTPILYTWIALTLSGSTMYRLARHFAPPSAATLAAVFYLANPYMLFTAFERTAYAELLAAAWIPLLFLAILRTRITIPRIAIPVALLWLTNAPAAVMSCYALAFLTAIRLISRRRAALTTALRTAAGTLLGLGLAAFYIVPAAYERRFVQIAMAILPSLRIQDNFLFHHTGDPARDAVIRTASFLSILLLALTTAALLWLYFTIPPTLKDCHLDRSRAALSRGAVERPPYFVFALSMLSVWHWTGSFSTGSKPGQPRKLWQTRTLLIPLTILTVVVAVLLTPISLPLWNHLPELAFLQFPWRILALLTTILALAAALALSRLRLRPAVTIVAALPLAALLTFPAYRAFHQRCDTTMATRLSLFHSASGAEPTDEYTPTTADNDALAPHNPPFWLSPDPAASAPVNSIPGPAPTHLTLISPYAQTLILNLRDYPAWRVTLNGALLTSRDQRDDGLMALPVPAGSVRLSLTYATLPDQTFGLILSLFSAILLVLLLLWQRHRSVIIKH